MVQQITELSFNIFLSNAPVISGGIGGDCSINLSISILHCLI